MRLIITVLLFLIFSSNLSQAGHFKIMTENLKPYNYLEGGELKGISTEIVKKVLDRLGYDNETIDVYPWARAIAILESKNNGILFSASYTQERAEKFKYACPLVHIEVSFFKHRESDLRIDSLEDAKQVSRVGVVKGFAAHNYLSEKGFDNFDFSSSTKIMVEKLIDKKVDIIPAVPESIYSLNKENLDLSEIVKTDYMLYRTNLCVMFNNSVKDFVVSSWKRELQKIHNSNEYDKIYSKYMDIMKNN